MLIMKLLIIFFAIVGSGIFLLLLSNPKQEPAQKLIVLNNTTSPIAAFLSEDTTASSMAFGLKEGCIVQSNAQNCPTFGIYPGGAEGFVTNVELGTKDSSVYLCIIDSALLFHRLNSQSSTLVYNKLSDGNNNYFQYLILKELPAMKLSQQVFTKKISLSDMKNMNWLFEYNDSMDFILN